MYCIKCGVKLANTEKKCPLCNTAVVHPEFTEFDDPIFPENKLPKSSPNSKFICGAVIMLFLIPVAVCFFADMLKDGKIDWFGYVLGAILVGYIVFALPLWFKKPNPVIFAPCDFAAAALYLLYINFATGSNWYIGYAFELTVALGVITCTAITLLYYLRRGRLFVVGGTAMAVGGFLLLTEMLTARKFCVGFSGWSIYPLTVLFLLGGLLIYLGISRRAREIIERKFFI
ncbi:MAG: hypothetical protein J6Q74_01000 [Clostridia bacterium]|nr:hypothetical protein [Clostridia bacterium]